MLLLPCVCACPEMFQSIGKMVTQMRFTDISCYDLMMMNMTWPPGSGDDDDDWQVPTLRPGLQVWVELLALHVRDGVVQNPHLIGLVSGGL